MKNIFSFMKSTRSLLAFMAMLLLFVVTVGSLMGAKIQGEVLALVGTTIGSIITVYYGKRDTKEDRGQ